MQRKLVDIMKIIQDDPAVTSVVGFTGGASANSGASAIVAAHSTTVAARSPATSGGSTTIAAIYKDRWQIELFFKALKQNLKIKTFVGTSANAVRTQIWTALISMLLLRYLQLRARFGWSMAGLVALLRMKAKPTCTSSLALVPMMCTPTSRRVSASNNSFSRPPVSPMICPRGLAS